MASSENAQSIQNDKNWNLLCSVRANNYDRVKQLLIDGADPNYTPDYTVDGKIGPLHSAVRHGHPLIVRLLLKYNADPNIEDEEGATPLFAALFSYTPPAIRKDLIGSGADMNHKNKSGTIPLIKMIENYMYWGYEFEKQTLLDLLYSCYDLYQKTTNGMSLVHLLLVVHSSERSVVSTPDHVCLVYLNYLMKKGIPMDTLDPLGRTAIHYAASASCYQSIELLIENGVNANIKDIKGQTAFHHLRFHSNERMNTFKKELPKLIDILIKHGCDINERDFFGRTILHYIANTDSTTTLSSLILLRNKGAILTVKDNANMTALHLAVLPRLDASDDEDTPESVSTILKEKEEDCDNLNKLNSLDAIKFLVENGVGVNETDISQLTALHLAVREQSTGVIQALLQLGADINKTTKTGESALHRATLNIKNFKCVITYCRLGTIDMNKQDNFGSTPLHWASLHSNDKFKVTYLLKIYGAVIDIKDHNDKLASELYFTHVPEDHVSEYGRQYKSQRQKYPVYRSFNLKSRNIEVKKKRIVGTNTNELCNLPIKATQTKTIDTMKTNVADNATNKTEHDASMKSFVHFPINAKDSGFKGTKENDMTEYKERFKDIRKVVRDTKEEDITEDIGRYKDTRKKVKINKGEDIVKDIERSKDTIQHVNDTKEENLVEYIEKYKDTRIEVKDSKEEDALKDTERYKDTKADVKGNKKEDIIKDIERSKDTIQHDKDTKEEDMIQAIKISKYTIQQVKDTEEEEEEVKAIKRYKDAIQVKDTKEEEEVKAIKRYKDAIQVKDTKEEEEVKAIKRYKDAIQVKDTKEEEEVKAIKTYKDVIQVKDTKEEEEVKAIKTYKDSMSVRRNFIKSIPNTQNAEINTEVFFRFVEKVFDNPPLNMALVNNIADNESVAAAVHALLLNISEKINSDFPLFANSISLTGSWNEGTKTLYPNEFDYNWHLCNFNEAFTINKNTTLSGGYVRLHLKESMKASDFVSYVNEEGELDGRKVICDFYHIINNILLLADIACPGNIYVKKYLTIDKGSIDKLVLEWVGPVYKCMLVNVDIVPSIEAKQFSSNYIQLDRNIMGRICRDEPLEIVLKTPNERVVRDANFYFRISVAKLESLIIKSLPTSIKKGFSLLKMLRDFIYPHSLTHKRGFEFMLTTYKLKTCFLHVLEEAAKHSEDITCTYVPQESCIETEKTFDNDEKEEEKIEKKKLLEIKASKRITIDWACRIVDFLSRSIEDAFLPSFFLPSVNLHVNESQSICNDIHTCKKECKRLKELLAEEMKNI